MKQDALVNHPHFGSLWLQNVQIERDHVVGEVTDGNGYNEPMWATMNFPITCVRKWDPPLLSLQDIIEGLMAIVKDMA